MSTRPPGDGVSDELSEGENPARADPSHPSVTAQKILSHHRHQRSAFRRCIFRGDETEVLESCCWRCFCR